MFLLEIQSQIKGIFETCDAAKDFAKKEILEDLKPYIDKNGKSHFSDNITIRISEVDVYKEIKL